MGKGKNYGQHNHNQKAGDGADINTAEYPNHHQTGEGKQFYRQSNVPMLKAVAQNPNLKGIQQSGRQQYNQCLGKIYADKGNENFG